MSFFSRAFRPPPPRPTTEADELHALAREHMPAADPETQRLVVAVAGLLASVAYADREYRPQEQAYARQALARIGDLTPEGVEAICELLATRGAALGAVNPQAYTRELRERTEPEFRREVLEVLVDLAAADDELALSETDVLRRTTAALGLTPEDYLSAQARHRDKLSLLR